MTVLVGILCKDGIVIASDSAATLGASPATCTIEQPYHKKVQVLANARGGVGGQVIVAVTGSVGLAQRLEAIVQAHCESGTFARETPVDTGVAVCKDAVHNFNLTKVSQGSIGALVAYWGKGGPALIEFGQADFQPEVKNDAIWWASMGSGEPIADPILALLVKAFCGDGMPRLSTGIFMATWALSHVIETNTGGIKDPMHLVVLRADGSGGFRAEELSDAELGEHEQNVQSVYAYMGKYPGAFEAAEAPPLPEPKPS